MEELRSFLKDRVRQTVDLTRTDQALGLPPPPLEKPLPDGATPIPLPLPEAWTAVADLPVMAAIARRRSHRRFAQRPLSLEELAFLLWATQGIRAVGEGAALRTVPSAGCRHPFETYLAVFGVAGLERGLYRYLPLEHALLRLEEPDELERRTVDAALGQPFAARGAVTFLWTALPARTEWRYGNASVKVIALDAGHVCQNLYLACEAVDAGTCAIAAYDQDRADELVGVDGVDEFVVYMAPVGKV
jgi:SagB-type dehydrogenase family enzyme